MITAIVFVSAAVDRISEVAEGIAAIPGVSEVYSVTGEIDPPGDPGGWPTLRWRLA